MCSIQDEILCGTDMENATTTNCSAKGSLCAEERATNIIWETILFLIIFTVASVGNIFVIILVYRSRRSQWTSNYFVAHLAMSNITTPFICVLWSFVWSLTGKWYLDDALCKIVSFSHFLNASVSLGMISATSLDRYYITIFPFSFKLTRSQTKDIISFVWIFMLCGSAPSLYFFKTQTTANGREYCSVDFNNIQWSIYLVVFCLIIFFIPLCGTCAVYVKIIQAVLRRNREASKLGNEFQRHSHRVPTSKIRVLRLLLIQIIVYISCWVPYFLVILAQSLVPSSDGNHSVLIRVVQWVAYSNSGMNPILYLIFNGDFRRGCKQVCFKSDASSAYRLTSKFGRKNTVGILEMQSEFDETSGGIRLTQLQPKSSVVHGKDAWVISNNARV